MRKIGLALALIITLLVLPVSSSCSQTPKSCVNYQIECELEGETLHGRQTVTFTNITDNVIKNLKFNLFGNAFRKGATYNPIAEQYKYRAYPSGVNYGGMTINEVRFQNKEQDFEIGGKDQNVLIVPLKTQLYPDESVSVQIDFSLRIATVISRTGINDKTINLGNFYPTLCGVDENGFYECEYYSTGDPFYSNVSDYNVQLKVDKDYVVASSGKLVEKNIQNDKAVLKYSVKRARSFTFVLSKNFEVITENHSGVTINYYYYADQNPTQSVDVAKKSLDCFTKNFGAYPFETYSVVQTRFLQGGMEYTALSMIADDLEEQAHKEVIVHETAHQWWQVVVGNNEIEYGFLDEGLAEYSVVLFYELHPEYNLTRDVMISSAEMTYKTFCSVSDKLFGRVNTVMLRSLKEFSSEYEYVNISYLKPCIMYDYLRKTIGDERFFKGLKRYYQDYAFLNATPYDLAGSFEKVGAKTNGFFESFYNGKVVI